MKRITLDYSKSLNFIGQHEMENLQPAVEMAHKILHNYEGAGKEYTGWLELPHSIDNKLIRDIKNTALDVQNKCDVFIIVGIGGSYLGAKAAIEMLTHHFHNQLASQDRKAPEIYFAGHHISSTYLKQLLDLIEKKEVCINVISKSGTTTEPAIAFRILKRFMENKYGKEGASKRTIATTDKEKGALKELANEEGYKTYVIPDDVGGRYSVLTPVGLLPMAVAGIDVEEILEGAKEALKDTNNPNIKENHCYQYAAIRNILYRKNKTIEMLVGYEPSLQYFGEWWKQLFGESEGKDSKGIFPATGSFSTDLHSMGQYIQQGIRNLFETVIQVEESIEEIVIEAEANDLDGLNYLAGKTMTFVNQKAFEGTTLAHIDGGVPNLIINVPKLTPYYFGYLVYFFEKACGISGYILGVNPFNQPGVEDYKKNMFALLGKKGYEEERKALEERLK
ncbi:glucose-6-phosphate isomerase [Alkaliphilus serpentinus]|uniref:Glucose-6-phosphate isomerase n=1 Tax=Alkaliphilus serpentinus TaxID=1482731 RepID=A0A833HM74_9FIRM|nr:glucose-6-phosphate isomerase [Alkaliphilus serpentinus]KAB3525840.1 glucose-6-phosphate isomerase [Alkaliphilus serpentinus]